MRNALLAISAALLVLTTVQCASSSGRVVESYRAPGTVSFVFDRGAVFVLNGGPELRASLEDEVIRTAARPRLVAGHTIVQSADLRSTDSVKANLLAQKFDGMLVMRIVRASEIDTASSVAGEVFSTYADKAGEGEPAFGKDQVRVEASIFRLADEQLVWRAVAEVKASKDPITIARDAVKVFLESLRSTGLVHD